MSYQRALLDYEERSIFFFLNDGTDNQNGREEGVSDKKQKRRKRDLLHPKREVCHLMKSNCIYMHTFTPKDISKGVPHKQSSEILKEA